MEMKIHWLQSTSQLLEVLGPQLNTDIPWNGPFKHMDNTFSLSPYILGLPHSHLCFIFHIVGQVHHTQCKVNIPWIITIADRFRDTTDYISFWSKCGLERFTYYLNHMCFRSTNIQFPVLWCQYFLSSTVARSFDQRGMYDFRICFWGNLLHFEMDSCKRQASIKKRITVINNGWKAEVVWWTSENEDSKKIYCLFLRASVAAVE